MGYINLINNISNWPLYFKYKLGFDTPDPLGFCARNNIIFESPKRLYSEFKEIFLENVYIIGQQRKITKTDPVIIDIGANVGLFSIFAISKYPQCHVYSYEPIQSNFKQLLRNSELNKDKDFNCFNIAVCGRAGTIKIYRDRDEQFTTTASIFKNNESNKDFEVVKCITLADIIDENNIQKCDFLKMDCEGAEYEILYNTPKQYLDKVDQIALEVHQGENEGENLQSLRSFLKNMQFGLVQIKNWPHMLWAFHV